MHVVSVYDVPFQQAGEKRRKKEMKFLYVRRAIKKCFSEIATSAFCTRTPEITGKKIKSHHEWKIFRCVGRQQADDIRVVERGMKIVHGAEKKNAWKQKWIILLNDAIRCDASEAWYAR